MTHPQHWIGREDPIDWPPCSPDLTPLDFFFWRHVKSLMYETSAPKQKTLLARILAAFDKFPEIHDILGGVRQNFPR